MNVFSKPGDRFGNSVKRRIGGHVSSLISENPKGKNGLISPERGGGMVYLPGGVDANAMDGCSDSPNAVRETGSGLALDINFLLEGGDYLLGCVVYLFVHGGGLLAGAVAALSQKSFKSSGAYPQKFKTEFDLGIEFRFEPAGEFVQGAP